MKTPPALPQSLTAEQSAVSILAQVPSAITAFGWSEGMFLNPACRTLFGIIAGLRQAGSECEMKVLLSRLETSGKLETVGGEDGLREIVESYPLQPGAGFMHADTFYADLVGCSTRREVIMACSRMEPDLRSGQLSAATFVSNLSDIATPPEARRRESLADQLDGLIDEIEHRNPPEAFGFGLPRLDAILDGGFQRGELVMVAGPTGGGKSLLLAQAALCAVRSGHSTAFFSLEMPAKAVLRRLVANMANMALPKAQELSSDEQLKAISLAVARVSKMPITIIGNMLSLSEIETEARRLSKLGKADIVVVDYVQRVHNASADNREQSVAEITSRLKSLAIQENCAVLSASQLNRQGEVRESAAIEFDSDILLKITPESIFGQKFRRGASNFSVKVTMRGELGRFDL